MYLYSKSLQKNVYVAKVESDPEIPAAQTTVIVWSREKGWQRCGLMWFEPPRQEGKE